MPEPLFKVICRGEIAAGFTRAQVQENLQKLCNYNAETAAKLLYGRAVTIKANADQATAERILAAMARAGAICSIEPMVPLATAEAAPENSTAVPAAPSPVEAEGTAASSQARWLLRELPKLVGAGVLDEAAAGRLRSHYASVTPPRRTSLALVICAVLGALLVGLGIILIFAHNWSELSRSARTFFALAPLVLAQGLTAWVIERHRESTAWREGTAVFLIAAVGAAIALIGQTYHLADDLGRFLLTWTLLSLPLVFLLRSAMAAILYWLGIAAWVILTPYDRWTQAWFWLLMAPPGWLFWEMGRRLERPLARTWLLWVLACCLTAAIGFAGQARAARLLPLYCGLLFGLYYLADRAWMTGEKSLGRRPLLLLGSFGAVVLSLSLTLRGAAREAFLSMPMENIFRLFGSATFSILFAGYFLLLFYLLFRRRDLGLLPFGLIGLLMLPIHFASRDWSGAGAIFFNAYLLLLGGTTLAAGLRQERLAKVNGALGIFALLLTLRFFDTDLPFTVKGVAFVVVGICFLAVNLLLRRRLGEVAA